MLISFIGMQQNYKLYLIGNYDMFHKRYNYSRLCGGPHMYNIGPDPSLSGAKSDAGCHGIKRYDKYYSITPLWINRALDPEYKGKSRLCTT